MSRVSRFELDQKPPLGTRIRRWLLLLPFTLLRYALDKILSFLIIVGFLFAVFWLMQKLWPTAMQPVTSWLHHVGQECEIYSKEEGWHWQVLHAETSTPHKEANIADTTEITTPQEDMLVAAPAIDPAKLAEAQTEGFYGEVPAELHAVIDALRPEAAIISHLDAFSRHKVGELGEAAVPALLDLLHNHENPAVKQAVLNSLAAIATEDSNAAIKAYYAANPPGSEAAATAPFIAPENAAETGNAAP